MLKIMILLFHVLKKSIVIYDITIPDLLIFIIKYIDNLFNFL